MLIKQSRSNNLGLNKDMKYNFCDFGSRSASSDNRDTKFITAGKNTVVVSQNTLQTKQKLCVRKTQPNDSGEIEITVTAEMQKQ